MLEQSTFVAPNYIIDTFDELQDLKYSELQYLDEYRTLKMQKNDGLGVNETRLAELESIFANKIITSARWNKFQNCLINMENFMINEVDNYVTLKQNEFQAEIDKFIYIGDYNSTTQYYKKNIITLNGESYLCLQNSKGNNPNPNQNTTYWAKISKQGVQGIPGVGLTPNGVYDPVVSYVIDNLVNYNGSLYRCIESSLGNLPTNTTYFELFLSGILEDLNGLNTINKISLVNAINEVNNKTDENITDINTINNLVGQADGLATLDENGNIPPNQLGNIPLDIFPYGGIIMWYGEINTIPTGWALCDGSEGTPDLRNRFIVGAGNEYQPGATGGVDEVILTENQIPSHTHNISKDGTHNHTYYAPGGGTVITRGSEQTIYNARIMLNTSDSGKHNHAAGKTGSGLSHENRPPFYALAFIMKI